MKVLKHLLEMLLGGIHNFQKKKKIEIEIELVNFVGFQHNH